MSLPVISSTLSIINARLEELVSKKAIKNETLFQAANYALFTGGKRLRPQMLLAITEKNGLDVACAIELIHTYSLIHDDLPSMDDDDYRRGKPSLHKAFSESIAILTGDFFLTYAFEVIANANLPPNIKVTLIQTLSKHIGSSGMVGGQVLDMAAKSKSINWETYQELANKKTGALFITPFECGAIIENLPPSEQTTLISFGKLYGLIYQISDDLEDLDSPSAVSILGEAKAIEMKNLLISNAQHLLTLLSKPYPFLEKSLSRFLNS